MAQQSRACAVYTCSYRGLKLRTHTLQLTTAVTPALGNLTPLGCTGSCTQMRTPMLGHTYTYTGLHNLKQNKSFRKVLVHSNP